MFLISELEVPITRNFEYYTDTYEGVSILMPYIIENLIPDTVEGVSYLVAVICGRGAAAALLLLLVRVHQVSPATP